MYEIDQQKRNEQDDNKLTKAMVYTLSVTHWNRLDIRLHLKYIIMVELKVTSRVKLQSDLIYSQYFNVINYLT
jgi:hypothetical protein